MIRTTAPWLDSAARATDQRDMDPSLPAPLPAAPDLLGPVHAFRDWRALPQGLTSPRTGVTWTARELTAECRPRTPEDLVRPAHRAPGRECSCGIHGYFRPGYETSKVDFSGVTGVITAWGEVEVHHDGIRAEYARVEALGIYSRWTRRQKAAVFALADALDVDLLDLYDLEVAAGGYAAAVPPGLVPEPVRRARRGRAVPAPAPARVLVFGH
jgi:hypothetical protein